jgi:hypothetical protein
MQLIRDRHSRQDTDVVDDAQTWLRMGRYN